jgi:hypothetical protein
LLAVTQGGEAVGKTWARSGILLGVGAIAVALASAQPFDHYWALPLAAVPVLAAGRLRWSVTPRAAALLVAMSLVPLGVHAVVTQRQQSKLVAEYRAAAELLEVQLAPGDTFVSFDIRPFLATFLPKHVGLRAPSSAYLAWPSSRTETSRSELLTLIEEAEVIADDGGLSMPEEAIYPRDRDTWRILQAYTGQFRCVRQLGELTLRFRPERCPRPSPA